MDALLELELILELELLELELLELVALLELELLELDELMMDCSCRQRFRIE
jgi:hypothetical protein